MSAVEKLQKIQEKNKSLICLGFDLDPKKMPLEYAKSVKSMFDFAMLMVEATADLVCAYKPNLAFYESRGPEGLSLLKSIVERMPNDIPIILDGKRGDIGNTASFYAEALFERYRADWVTLNPYMGYDSMRPFLEYKDKGVFVICLTSNSGSKDFQHLIVDGKPLYQIVAEKVMYWNKEDNCGLVVGATQPEQLRELRAVTGNMPLLIPGVGAQGGSLEKAVMYGTDNFQKPALVNVSRSVLYASKEADFIQKAVEELKKLNATVAALRRGEIKIDDDAPMASPEPPVPENKPSTFQLPPIPQLPHEIEAARRNAAAESPAPAQPPQTPEGQSQQQSQPTQQPSQQQPQSQQQSSPQPQQQPRPQPFDRNRPYNNHQRRDFHNRNNRGNNPHNHPNQNNRDRNWDKNS